MKYKHRIILYLLILSGCVVVLYPFRARAVERIWLAYYCLFKATCIPAPEGVVFESDFFGMRYRGDTETTLDKAILYFGAFAKSELYFIRDLLLLVEPKGDAVVVDVGANTGQHSLFMSKYARQVHAIEPWEPVLVRFNEMIALNGITNIKVYPIGLGAEDTHLEFFIPPGYNTGVGSFIEGFRDSGSGSEILPIAKGDSLLQKAAINRLDFIKIDIEGYEVFALRGLSETLDRYRPVVLVEITSRIEESIQSRNELETLFPAGYAFYKLTEPEHRGPILGIYYLEPFDFDFDSLISGQVTVVAFPIENDVVEKLID